MIKLENGEKEVIKLKSVAVRRKFIAYFKIADEQKCNVILTNKRLLFQQVNLVSGGEGLVNRIILLDKIQEMKKTKTYFITPSIRLTYLEGDKLTDIEMALNPQLSKVRTWLTAGYNARKDERDHFFDELSKLTHK